MSEVVNFKVGDQVVYPSHGVGVITGEENHNIGGHEISMHVILFEKDKMTLRVPAKRASASGLRHLSNNSNVTESMAVLKSRPKPGRGMWSRRAQEYEAKINSGDILLIAEVVRDLHKNVDDPDRSYSERVIYEAALNRLAGEYAAVEDVEISVAIDQIVSVLKSKRTRKKADDEIADIEDAA